MFPENGTSWQRRLLPVLALAVLWLVAYAPVPAAYAKDNPEDFTRVYAHSYDEVWDATHEAIERLGWFFTSEDKDKGTISGNGVVPNGRYHYDFTIHVEPVSPKPEARATMDVKGHGFMSGIGRRNMAEGLFRETQKVLATYK